LSGECSDKQEEERKGTERMGHPAPPVLQRAKEDSTCPYHCHQNTASRLDVTGGEGWTQAGEGTNQMSLYMKAEGVPQRLRERSS
jgi:hypothetical protein